MDLKQPMKQVWETFAGNRKLNYQQAF